ncbi:MAG TPA: class I SAM-dependent methyltransferase [Acidimicrobiales bacterium]|nr:class I SAM-dependent methyltransferase [Acidimicrobiales bacterium]
MTFVNAEQAEFWAGRAPSWMALEASHERIIGPAGSMAMDRLDPRPGQHLIDLGCGTGQTTVELARRVGPEGTVLGVDIAAAMLERGREHAAAAGISNIAFEHADVQSTDLGAARFDGAFSRFGVMFFADPTAAFTNVHRALKPGGFLSFACWQGALDNEWMSVPTIAAVGVLGTMPEMPGPEEPGPFSLADPDRVTAVLGAAGFSDIDILAHADQVHISEADIAETVQASLRVGAVQRMLEGADDDTVGRVAAAIDAAMRDRLKDGALAFNRSVLLVRALA